MTASLHVLLMCRMVFCNEQFILLSMFKEISRTNFIFIISKKYCNGVFVSLASSFWDQYLFPACQLNSKRTIKIPFSNLSMGYSRQFFLTISPFQLFSIWGLIVRMYLSPPTLLKTSSFDTYTSSSAYNSVYNSSSAQHFKALLAFILYCFNLECF